MTNFCSEKITVEGLDFWFDGNGKITLDGGTFENPRPNAFSLVHVQDCPGATETCKSVCYVHGLEKNANETYEKYKENSKNIRTIIEDDWFCLDTALAFSGWIERKAPQGFRWHVSGDIFSEEYAEFIASVCRTAPDVKFWLYTRSFEFMTPLLNVSNLVINLSADRDNYQEAMMFHQIHDLRICYLTIDGTLPSDLPVGSVIFPDYSLRGRELSNPKEHPWWGSLFLDQQRMVCPVDFFGQSETMRCGPCNKCLI